jgi:hypothetical protein
VLEELRRDVFVLWFFDRQLQRHREHRAAIEGHPGRAVRLFERAAGRERF